MEPKNDKNNAGGVQQDLIHVQEEEEPEMKDPFDWILRCQRRSFSSTQQDGSSTTPSTNDADDPPMRVLLWHSPTPPIPIATEQALLAGKQLIRYGAKERGMMKSQPDWRKNQVRRLCDQHGVSVELALSLRRHVMKQFNPYKNMPALRLGREDEILESSRRFEGVIHELLQRQDVPFYSEAEIKRHIQQHRGQRPFPPTPDFVLHQEMVIETFVYKKNKNDRGSRKRQRTLKNTSQIRTIQRRSVCWIDAKMFYGASTIDHDNNSAVGCLLATARKYTAVYGPGAFVFFHGYGDQLANELDQTGTMALDCTGEHVHCLLKPVRDHQRTWCADAKGDILP